jgi:hypothetical protein
LYNGNWPMDTPNNTDKHAVIMHSEINCKNQYILFYSNSVFSYAEYCYAEDCFADAYYAVDFVLIVVMLRVIMLCVIMLSVIMQNVIMRCTGATLLAIMSRARMSSVIMSHSLISVDNVA